MSVLAGTPLTASLSELRAALRAWQLHHANKEDAPVVDALLDAIYAHLAGSSPRPWTASPPVKAALGVWPPSLGTGQQRFWFVSRDRKTSREALYDRVAGLLHRSAGPEILVRALYLYPPHYLRDDPSVLKHD